jgi:DNA-binding XRE family transcriptional regulator
MTLPVEGCNPPQPPSLADSPAASSDVQAPAPESLAPPALPPHEAKRFHSQPPPRAEAIPHRGRVVGDAALDTVGVSHYTAPMLLLRKWRERRGLSLRELARKAGMDFSTVHRIEKGTMSPTVNALEKLARALGIEARQLLPRGWPPRAKRTRGRPQ